MCSSRTKWILSRKWILAGCLPAILVVAVATSQRAGAQKRLSAGGAAFRADATLVVVPITVVDRRGAVVNGLNKDAFTLLEDGVEQPIRWFSEEETPVSVGIVLDLSGSMRAALGDAKESLRSLMQGCNPTDEVFLNAVTTRPRPYFGFTRDFGGVLSRMAFENAGGDTALHDTIFASLLQLRYASLARKALLVVSDGMDNHSRLSREEVLQRAVETDAQVYSVIVGNAAKAYTKAMERREEDRGILFLDELSARTGGMTFAIRERSDIAGTAVRIGRALRDQYSIGYAPQAGVRSGQWRRIAVSVKGTGLKVYARTGYRNEL